MFMVFCSGLLWVMMYGLVNSWKQLDMVIILIISSIGLSIGRVMCRNCFQCEVLLMCVVLYRLCGIVCRLVRKIIMLQLKFFYMVNSMMVGIVQLGLLSQLIGLIFRCFRLQFIRLQLVWNRQCQIIVIVIRVVIIGVNSVVWNSVLKWVVGVLSSMVVFSDMLMDSGIFMIMKQVVFYSDFQNIGVCSRLMQLFNLMNCRLVLFDSEYRLKLVMFSVSVDNIGRLKNMLIIRMVGLVNIQLVSECCFMGGFFVVFVF